MYGINCASCFCMEYIIELDKYTINVIKRDNVTSTAVDLVQTFDLEWNSRNLR